MSEYVWAIDPQVGHLAFAFAPLDGGPIEVETLRTACDAREGERLFLLAQRVGIFARHATDIYPAACVWIEQPSGTFIKPQLYYTVGVVQAVVFEQTGMAPVWSIPSGTWKKNALGYGNASKEQVAAWVERAGGSFASQDEADAYAMACAGRRMFTERRWEVAA